MDTEIKNETVVQQTKVFKIEQQNGGRRERKPKHQQENKNKHENKEVKKQTKKTPTKKRSAKNQAIIDELTPVVFNNKALRVVFFLFAFVKPLSSAFDVSSR